ncbi:hypothetical protein BZA05DRAFT_402284 [Tricharina praecox]|uniref:uncharacterized protein n=1 Tax=Tricharina praecox TaxID=43433 RepID=UPI00221FF754|nr:uncharacterized protein BZA05DRAFT_402284 [Tricharina praecox]KAI5849131.1 hypothetical protein BZA05DRAFT_402284 [Tricharina praecox]
MLSLPAYLPACLLACLLACSNTAWVCYFTCTPFQHPTGRLCGAVFMPSLTDHLVSSAGCSAVSRQATGRSSSRNSQADWGTP